MYYLVFLILFSEYDDNICKYVPIFDLVNEFYILIIEIGGPFHALLVINVT